MNATMWRTAVESFIRSGWDRDQALDFYEKMVPMESHDKEVCLRTINDLYPVEDKTAPADKDTDSTEENTGEVKKKAGRPKKNE